MGAQVICLSGIIFHENTRVGFRGFYLPTQFPYLMMVTLIGLVELTTVVVREPS